MIRLYDIVDASDEDDEDDEDDDEPHSAYQWCLHCERAYKRGEHRLIGGIRMCPYPGCDGSIFADSWDWDEFRRPLPQYPAIPEAGVRYELYPKDFPVLTDGARKILVYLVAEIGKGRFDPENERKFCTHKEIHEALGFHRITKKWCSSLGSQGLAHLHKWTCTHQLPAITGLVLSDKKPRRPESHYYKEYGVPDGSVDWWRERVRGALELDWTKWMAGNDV